MADRRGDPERGGVTAVSTSEAESLHRALGLTDQEFDLAVQKLGREPNPTELAMFAVMWSEHCSYKSSKRHLRTLPTTGGQVLVGPGQDAGAVDLGNGVACVFKMESHSHPSAIEPVQGAATGVGGIVRDVLAMGARPAALLDPLRFGPLDEPRNRYLFGGVVAGIGQYGNSIGVPTVGGEVKFAPCHSSNPTVNVMCIGFAPADRVMTSTSVEDGDVLVLLGASTGRDGIGGVSVLASRTLDDDAHAARPSVQIADPFAEKLLIEACLELVEEGVAVAVQDLGGAGLTCAVSETAARAGMGAQLNLDVVPLRERGMEPYEILTSESQERMLAVVRPNDVPRVLALAQRWGLAATPVGTLERGAELRSRWGPEVVASVPADALANGGPVYDRPMRAPAWLPELLEDDPAADVPPASLEDAFFSVLGSPGVASARWVYQQYDQLVQGGTVAGPGADAAVIRLEGTTRAVAVSTDGNGRYGHLDPYLGGAHAVAESARNVASVGARPLAITNCLNFANPERPEVMWSFAEAVRGIADACRAFGTPVTGGNVSFYNESPDSAVYPTPIVGMVGVLEDYRRCLRTGFPGPGLTIYLLGETFAELGGSQFAEAVLGNVSGRPPRLDFDAEARLHALLRECADRGVAASAHDLSDGGLAIALAEGAIAGGEGFEVVVPLNGLQPHIALFSESASRALLTATPGMESDLEALAASSGVPITRLGTSGGARLRFEGLFDVELSEAVAVYEGAIPRLMSRQPASA
ncbi:MAG: phosphoribosylformylglycinamidine synthase subunit PurL [Actinomycetota bacterium]|nr:phosphoribosylformylglycinamidine synthase subunit PurL [Actinomycetota bacterium]